MFSNVREVRYIDSKKDEYVLEEGIAGVPRLPNIGERIIDRDWDRDREELYYEVVEVRTVIDRTAGEINYEVYLKQV